MAGLLGRPGSWGGLVLRMGQTFFAAASIGVMVSSLGFAKFTAFCYLIAIMTLQMLWSFGLACLDGYAIMTNKNLTSPIQLILFALGDLVTTILSLAASASTAGLVTLLQKDINFCSVNKAPCGKYELATVFGFLSWALSATSALIVFWLLSGVF